MSSALPGSEPGGHQAVQGPLSMASVSSGLPDVRASDMESALLACKQTLHDQNVALEDTRVYITSELRAAVGEQAWPLFLRRLEEKMGRIIEVLTPLQEAAYLYAATLKHLPNPKARRKNLVIDIAAYHARLIFGIGDGPIEQTLTTQGNLPLGLKQLVLEDPFGPIDVALAREAIKHKLRELITEPLRAAVRKRHVFLPADQINLLAEIECQRSGTQGDIRAIGLSAATLAWYLVPEGLAYLQDLCKSGNRTDNPSGVYEAQAIERLVGTLLILRELMAHLGLDTVQIGSAGGEKAGILDEMARQQISQQSERFGRVLHRRYRRSYPQVLNLLRAIFPDLRLRGRVKDATSISDKIYRKAVRTGQRQQLIRSLEDAAQLIGDGHGLRLVLDTTVRRNLEPIRNQLIQAIQNGLVQVLEINNFHAGNAEALPYLAEEDIAMLRMATENVRRRTLNEAEKPQPITILDGPGAMKPAGYTTAQLNLCLKNPVNGQFDIVCELQIRGIEVDRFSSAEHLIHDFRRGKDPYKKSRRIRERFEPEVEPLLQAIREMPADVFTRFTDYLSQFYLHCRRLENGQVVPEPVMPEGLPEVCHVDNLKRLSRLQKRLIARDQRRLTRKAAIAVKRGHGPQ